MSRPLTIFPRTHIHDQISLPPLPLSPPSLDTRTGVWRPELCMGCKDRYMFSKVSSLLDLQYKTTVKLTFSRMCQRKKRKATCDSHKQLAKQLAKFVKATCEATCKIRESNLRSNLQNSLRSEFWKKSNLRRKATRILFQTAASY